MKKELRQIELRNIKLSKESRKAIRGMKSDFGEPLRDAIEYGTWHIPSKDYEFLDIKKEFEKEIHKFYSIPKDVLIEVDCFDTNILSFEKGIYPKYHK